MRIDVNWMRFVRSKLWDATEENLLVETVTVLQPRHGKFVERRNTANTIRGLHKF